MVKFKVVSLTVLGFLSLNCVGKSVDKKDRIQDIELRLSYKYPMYFRVYDDDKNMPDWGFFANINIDKLYNDRDKIGTPSFENPDVQAMLNWGITRVWWNLHKALLGYDASSAQTVMIKWIKRMVKDLGIKPILYYPNIGNHMSSSAVNQGFAAILLYDADFAKYIFDKLDKKSQEDILKAFGNKKSMDKFADRWKFIFDNSSSIKYMVQSLFGKDCYKLLDVNRKNDTWKILRTSPICAKNKGPEDDQAFLRYIIKGSDSRDNSFNKKPISIENEFEKALEKGSSFWN